MSNKPGRSKLRPPNSIQGLFKMVRDVMLGRQDVLENRRGGVRVRVALPVIARVGDQEYACETTDVSAAGIRLLFPEELAIGQQIRLSVPPEIGFIGKQRILFKVKWCEQSPGRGYQLGLKFADTEEHLEVSWLQDALKHFKLQEKANRKYRRIPAEVYAEVHSQDGAYIGKGICKNLSTGGAQLSFDRELSAGEILQLGMGPSDQETAITLLARVLVRQNTDQPGTYLHGLRFLKGDRRQHARFRSFLQTLLEEAESLGQTLDESPEVSLPDVTPELEHQDAELDDQDELVAQANARGRVRVDRPTKAPEMKEESFELDGPLPLGAPLPKSKAASKRTKKSAKVAKAEQGLEGAQAESAALSGTSLTPEQSPALGAPLDKKESANSSHPSSGRPGKNASPLAQPHDGGHSVSITPIIDAPAWALPPSPVPQKPLAPKDSPVAQPIPSSPDSPNTASSAKLIRLERQSPLQAFEAAHSVESVTPGHVPKSTVPVESPTTSDDHGMLSIDQLPHNSPKYRDRQIRQENAPVPATVESAQPTNLAPTTPTRALEASEELDSDKLTDTFEPVIFTKPAPTKEKGAHKVRRSSSLWAGRTLQLESQRAKKKSPPKGDPPP